MINTLSIIDDISSEFNNTIPTQDLMLSLLVAIVSAIIINLIYKKTYLGVSYNKSFSLSTILLTLVTTIVIRTINSNLSLSLGMVGALSIVRFRTSVKDPVDTIFMFWGITAGIMSGAGLYLVTVLSTLLIGLIYFISFSIQSKQDNKKLLVIVTDTSKSEEIIYRREGMKEDLPLSLSSSGVKMKESQEIKSINIIDLQ